MKWDTVQQFLRTAMQLVAGYLVANGVIVEDMTTMVVGGGVSLGAFLWWILWESKRANPDVPTV